MRARWTRGLAAVAVTALLTTGSVGIASASAPQQQALSDEYCSALGEQLGVSTILSFITAFSDLGEDSETGEKADPDEIQGSFLLVLSPTLQRVARTLSTEGPKKVRKLYRSFVKAFGEGVEILRDDVGLTDEQIDALRDYRFTTDADSAEGIEDVFDDNDIDEDEVKALGKKFYEDSRDALEFEQDDAALVLPIAEQCGLSSATDIDCETLVTPDDAAQILGTEVTLDDEEACAYLGPDPESGLQPELGVEVYETDRAFERLTESGDSEPLDSTGDEAVTIEGFSVNGGIKTCGRTVIAKADDRTVVVGICLPDDAPVSDDLLAQVGGTVLERL